MIFQYTRIVSSEDSKRHYRWECVSRNHEHLLIFLTPNGTRAKMISNIPNKKIETNQYGPIGSFADLLQPNDLAQYHRIIEDAPMIPYKLIERDHSQDDETDPQFSMEFNDNTYDSSLMELIYECHAEVTKMEFELLELDRIRQKEQQTDAFWTELTNVLAKVDSATFLSNCMQQLSKR